MALFDGKNVNFYSDIPNFIVRVKYVALLFLFAFPLCEFLFAEIFQFYEPNWFALAAITLINGLFTVLLYGHVFNKKQISYLTSILGSLGTIFLLWRSVEGDFSALFLMEIGAAIIFITFIVDKIFFALLYILPILATYLVSLSYVDWSSENHVAYVIGMIILLGFFLISISFKLFRLSLLQFSERVLNGYDKFVVVLDSRGNMVFVNNYAGKKFGFDSKLDKYSDWWKIRGYSEEETARYKKAVIEAIHKNESIPVNEQLTTLANGGKTVIEWSNQIVHGKFYVAIGSDISAEKLALSESQKLSEVTEALNAGVAIADKHGDIVWCNKAYAQIFEYESVEIIGRRPSQTFKVPSEFQQAYRDIIDNRIEKGLPVEIPHYTKSGRLIWVLLSVSKIKNDQGQQESIEVVTDITQQKNNELQFKQTSLIVERTQTPVLLCDNGGTINWFNSALSREFKDTFDNVIGHFFFEKYAGRWTDKEQIAFFLEQLKDNKSFQMDMLLMRQDLPQWYKLSVDPIKNDLGGITQFMIIMQNIQHLKDAQDTIEEKNRDILDSISYARRIQSALLPSTDFLEKCLPKHYIYYEPKDIVSGDFYYAKERNGLIFLAIADCTGHGVPGAMITSISSSALNNAIFDAQLTEPNEILEHTDKMVKKTLYSEEEELTDGMDIGLLVLDYASRKITFSGARRPLIVKYPEKDDIELIPSVKRSIGETDRSLDVVFTNISFTMRTGMQLYLFTDGLPDQFGGEKYKKIGLKRFLELMRKNENGLGGYQDGYLSDWMYEWMGQGQTKQIDDMLFFGMEFTEMDELLIEKTANITNLSSVTR